MPMALPNEGCQACQAGKYATEGAMGSCTPCPTGTTTVASATNGSDTAPEGKTGAKTIDECRRCIDNYCNGNGDCAVRMVGSCWEGGRGKEGRGRDGSRASEGRAEKTAQGQH